MTRHHKPDGTRKTTIEQETKNKMEPNQPSESGTKLEDPKTKPPEEKPNEEPPEKGRRR